MPAILINNYTKNYWLQQHHCFHWENFLALQIHEDAQSVKHKKRVKSVKKCIISNSLDGTEYSVPSKGSKSSDNDILMITIIKQSLYRSRQALSFPGGWGSQISRQSAFEGGKVVSHMHRPLLPRQEIFLVFISVGDCGGTVVKVLCYNSEGRWFDPSWCHWNFSLT